MAMIDLEGALELAAAVTRLWIHEAPHEIPLISAWLGCDPGALLAGLGLSEVPPAPSPPAPRPPAICEQCGAALAKGRAGPPRRFCDSCRARRRDDASLASRKKYGSRTRSMA